MLRYKSAFVITCVDIIQMVGCSREFQIFSGAVWLPRDLQLPRSKIYQFFIHHGVFICLSVMNHLLVEDAFGEGQKN